MTDILQPRTEQELSETIVQAAANGIGLKIQSGGTRSWLGNIVSATTTLSMKGFSGIKLYDAGALTIIAQAGTTYSEIKAALAAENQYLAFEPMDHRAIYGTTGEPTIGGVVAANISGPRRIQAGACRDALIGLRFVNGSGDIIKNGGRVMKNVTGLDLVKLMAGAYGSLGVLTEVTFKTLPQPERQATLVVQTETVAAAIKTMSAALCSPYEVNGAAYLPETKQTMLRLEGFESQVEYRLSRLASIVGDGQILEAAEHSDIWRKIRNVETFNDLEKPLWRLLIKPSDAAEIAKLLTEQLEAETLLDWGGGLIWAQMPDEANPHAEIIRAAMAKIGGSATLMRASNTVKNKLSVFQPQSAGVVKLSALMRQKFDPKGILNPNIMTGSA